MADRKNQRPKPSEVASGTTRRTNILKVFLTAEELKLIQIAASLAEESQTEFVRKLALEKAEAVMKEDKFLAQYHKANR